MTSRSQSVISRIIPGIVLGLLVLLGLMLLGDIQAVSRGMLLFDWRYLLAVLLLGLVNYFIRIIKWHYSLGCTGVMRLSFTSSAHLFLAAFPLTASQGKVGQALSSIWLKQKSGMPASWSSQALAADSSSDWIAALALLLVGVAAFPAYWLALLILYIALAGLVVLLKNYVTLDSWSGLVQQLPALAEAINRLRMTFSNGLALYRPSSGSIAFLLGLLSWIGDGVCLFLILIGAGLQPTLQLLAAAVWIIALASLAGGLSGLPGGLGAIEVALAAALTAFTGLPPALATVATVLHRLSTFWFKIWVGLIIWRFSPGLPGLRAMNGKVVES